MLLEYGNLNISAEVNIQKNTIDLVLVAFHKRSDFE